MKTKSLMTLLLVLCLGFASCSASRKAATTPPPASITMECTQITGDGNFIVEVIGDGKNVDAATENALVYAVRGLLFDGIPGSTANRIQSQKPLVQDASIRVAKKMYFQNFFDSGEYRLYVEALPNSIPRVVKVNGGYKAKVSVILKKGLLRHRLEKDGIIKSLGSPFK